MQSNANIDKRKHSPIIALVAYLFLLICAIFLSSCQSTSLSDCYLTRPSSETTSYRFNEASNRTEVRWESTITNNTIYDMEYFEATYGIYDADGYIGEGTFTYDVRVDHGKTYSSTFTFEVDGEVTSFELSYWTGTFSSFWDTYGVWIIVTASIAAVALIVYIICMIVIDIDLEDVGNFLGDHVSWAASIGLVLVASGALVAIISSHWVPALIILGGLLIVVLGALIAHLIKHLVEMHDFGGSYDDSDDDPLENYTVAELRQLCKNLGIKGYSSLTKEKLIDLINAETMKEDDEEEEEDEEEERPSEKAKSAKSPKTAPKASGVTFDDIAGLEEAKKAFREKVVLPFEHRELYEKYGKKVGGGVLLYGLPGTGKTMFAEAASNETSSLFIPIKCSDIKSKWYGESEAKVKDIFQRAKKAKKAIIFFDEFEAIGGKRNDDSDNANNDLVPQILAEMQGFGTQSKDSLILVIAATNKPWAIDSAFIRPGRFDEKIYIPLPDLAARKKLFELKLAKVPHEDLDLDYLASITNGFNGADIDAFVERLKMEGINVSISSGKEHKITMDDVKKIEGDVKSSVSLEDIERLEEFQKQYS